MDVKSVILATDQGTNMKSNKVKACHEVLGRALINYPVQTAIDAGAQEVGILVGDQGPKIKEVIDQDMTCCFLEASDPAQIIGFISESADVIVLMQDTPLLTALDLEQALIDHRANGNGATILSTQLYGPDDYGQVIIFKTRLLTEQLSKGVCFEAVANSLAKEGATIGNLLIRDKSHLLRVDSRQQLAKCTQLIKQHINDKHMDNGVTIEDPGNTYIGPQVTIGYDTVIEPNCKLQGKTTIGDGCTIGSNTTIENSHIANYVRIENSVIDQALVGDYTHIGPFAYIRPHSNIGKHVRVGDFVEIKNATIGDHTKISHLTYVGDADVGKHVNFGCGTVLVNYDGGQKHRSTIEDHAFIGCNTNLVSPVTIGERAFTAAGSTITKDVPGESLGISRARQVNKEGWVTYKTPKK